jgi:hypothetical protein
VRPAAPVQDRNAPSFSRTNHERGAIRWSATLIISRAEGSRAVSTAACHGPYNACILAFRDEQIASVLTFIRNTWEIWHPKFKQTQSEISCAGRHEGARHPTLSSAKRLSRVAQCAAPMSADF